MTDQTTPEALAQLFHETYERLAPEHGYRTREASAKPWADVPDANKALMIATCAEVLNSVDSREQAAIAELDSINATVIQTGAAHGLSGLAAVRQLGTRYQEEKDRAERLSRAYNAIRAERNEARAEADSDPVVLDLRARLAETRAENTRLHTWDGLMSLLDEHWPEDLYPTREDGGDRDLGPRIVSLLRWNARLRIRLDEARERYDAEEVIVDGNVFRRGNLPTILADSMNSGAEHAREAKRLASQIDRLADWLTEHTDEPKDSYGAVEAAINAIEERDAQLNEASAAAWEQGYALGVNDERTAESNIGIAGFGMKVSPARENPYRAAERVEPRHFALYGAVTTACGKAIPPDSPWEPSRGDWALATLTTRRASTTCQSCINRFDSESAGLDSPAPLTLAQAATALHGWAGDLADGARTDWPAGHPDIIRGIRAAADWLDARDKYETEARQQATDDYRAAATRAVVDDIMRMRQAVIQAAGPEETPEPAEPTLRDIMAAAYRAGLGIRKFDEYELDTSLGEPVMYREWSITNTHKREIGRLTIRRARYETFVQLDSRRTGDRPQVLTDPTPADILAAAREAGLIGDES